MVATLSVQPTMQVGWTPVLTAAQELGEIESTRIWDSARTFPNSADSQLLTMFVPNGYCWSRMLIMQCPRTGLGCGDDLDSHAGSHGRPQGFGAGPRLTVSGPYSTQTMAG